MGGIDDHRHHASGLHLRAGLGSLLEYAVRRERLNITRIAHGHIESELAQYVLRVAERLLPQIGHDNLFAVMGIYAEPIFQSEARQQHNQSHCRQIAPKIPASELFEEIRRFHLT